MTTHQWTEAGVRNHNVRCNLRPAGTFCKQISSPKTPALIVVLMLGFALGCTGSRPSSGSERAMGSTSSFASGGAGSRNATGGDRADQTQVHPAGEMRNTSAEKPVEADGRSERLRPEAIAGSGHSVPGERVRQVSDVELESEEMGHHVDDAAPRLPRFPDVESPVHGVPAPDGDLMVGPLDSDESGRFPLTAEGLIPTKSLTLPEVLMVLRESPQMAALRANIDIVHTDRVQAGLLPNPEFNYERFVTLTGDPDAANDPNMYTVAQPLLLFGQRGVAIETANRDISATQAEVFADYADRVVEARRLFATLLVREEAVRLLEESLEHFERVEGVVEGRFEEGDVSLYDLERIRVEVATFRSLMVTARAELAEASGEMASLLGTPGWLPLAAGNLKPLNVRFQYEELMESMQGIHPRILAARSREAAARSRIDLARKERLPVPELEMGWFDAQAPEPNFAGALYAGISIPTPLFDRGQATIGRAHAERRQAVLESQAVTAETQAELHGALSVLHHLRFTLDIYEQQMHERLPRLREMAEAGYEAGEILIVELLDAVNIFLEPQLSYLELLEAVMHAEIDVLSAAGMVEAHLEW